MATMTQAKLCYATTLDFAGLVEGDEDYCYALCIEDRYSADENQWWPYATCYRLAQAAATLGGYTQPCIVTADDDSCPF